MPYSIERTLEMPLNKLRRPKEKRTEEIIPNPNNYYIFPIIGKH